MFKYLTKRMALAILTLFIILIFAYTLIVINISNPFENFLQNPSLKESEKAHFQKLVKDFDETPIIQKIGTYFSNFFRFNYGEMYAMTPPNGEKNDIPSLFFAPLKWSILVSLPSFIISSLLGITLGIVAGYKRGTVYDSIINVFVFIFIAIPSFIVAPILINLFVKIGFPIRFINPQEGSWAETIHSLIPAITVISLGSLAGYTLYARNQTVTVLTSNYILIAKTKGMSSGQIFLKYVLRNISIPLAAIIIPSYLILLSGSIVVEKFWSIPGTSSIIASAFPSGEINVVMFNIFFFTALSLFTEIIVDISFALLDPRITYQSNSGINLIKFIQAAKSRKEQIKLLEQQRLEEGVKA